MMFFSGNCRPCFLFIHAMIVAFIVIIITHFTVANYDHRELEAYAEKLLKRREDVAAESQQIIDRVNENKNPPCSDAFLEDIRSLAFNSGFIADIGYVQNHMLKCSAMRGRLTSDVLISKPDIKLRNGKRIWTSYSGLENPRVTADMVELDNILLFNSPTVLRDISSSKKGLGGIYVNGDRSHLYKKFGDDSGLFKDFSRDRLWSLSNYQLTRCSELYDVCVIVRNSNVGLFSLPNYYVAIIAILGLGVGFILGFIALPYTQKNKPLSKRLKSAIINDEIYLNYQPFVKINSKKVIGYEALARWRDINGDNIPPDIFISIAETNHLIQSLTRKVISHSFRDMQRVLRKDNMLFLSINITTADVTDPEFIIFIEKEISHYYFRRDQVVFEITERLTTDHRLLNEALNKLRVLGYRIALDDFGTGFSNIDYLTKLSFDFIKVDKSFTDSIGIDSISFSMLKMMLDMLRQLDVIIIIEGIEEREQENYLMHNYNDVVGQGWLYGKPTSIDTIIGTTK